MGYSITEETGQKLDRNRREGRLCMGGYRHCVSPATRVVTTTGWLHKIGEGKSDVSTMKFCGRHAKEYVPGYRGVNFIVTGIDKLKKTV